MYGSDMAPSAFSLVAIVILLIVALLLWRARSRRNAQAFSKRPERLAALRDFFFQAIPIFARLTPEQQKGFCERASVFLEDQRMFYVDDQRFKELRPLDEVDETLGWRIAAAAATLSLGVPELRWPRTRDILVYPTAFDENYDSNARNHITGMVHAQGPVIFSARDLVHSFQHEEGYNVALHELAHVLDMADGYADGSLDGVRSLQGEPWDQGLRDRVTAIRGGRYKKLRGYAGTNPAEFFAVAVEAFFEEPSKLRSGDDELYRRLVDAFHFDPANLRSAGG